MALKVALLASLASYLPLVVEAYSSHKEPLCNDQCSLDQLQRFWSKCCCVRCGEDGSYQNLPDGMSSDVELPWWICCDVARPYSIFVSTVPFFMLIVGINFWFWWNGHAVFPTSIVELSKSTGGSPKQECGSKEGLSGWHLVRSAALRSQQKQQQQKQQPDHGQPQTNPQQQEGGASFVPYDYWAIIQFYKESGETEELNVPLKSHAAYKQLEEYCVVREGKCYQAWTIETTHPTYGYQLVTFPDTQELFLYRAHFYHSKWKFEVLFFGLTSLLATLSFWTAAPNLHSLGIIVAVHLLTILLSGVLFYFFGAHGVVGTCGIVVTTEDQPTPSNRRKNLLLGNRNKPNNIHDYVDFSDHNPGLTSENYSRPVV